MLLVSFFFSICYLSYGYVCVHRTGTEINYICNFVIQKLSYLS